MGSDRSIEAAVSYGPQSVGCDFVVSTHLLFLDSWYAYISSDCREKDLHERFIALSRCHPPFPLLLWRVMPARPPHIIKNTTLHRYLNQHHNATPQILNTRDDLPHGPVVPSEHWKTKTQLPVYTTSFVLQELQIALDAFTSVTWRRCSNRPKPHG
jgi:hypothetical protein